MNKTGEERVFNKLKTLLSNNDAIVLMKNTKKLLLEDNKVEYLSDLRDILFDLEEETKSEIILYLNLFLELRDYPYRLKDGIPLVFTTEDYLEMTKLPKELRKIIKIQSGRTELIPDHKLTSLTIDDSQTYDLSRYPKLEELIVLRGNYLNSERLKLKIFYGPAIDPYNIDPSNLEELDCHNIPSNWGIKYPTLPIIKLVLHGNCVFLRRIPDFPLLKSLKAELCSMLDFGYLDELEELDIGIVSGRHLKRMIGLVYLKTPSIAEELIYIPNIKYLDVEEIRKPEYLNYLKDLIVLKSVNLDLNNISRIYGMKNLILKHEYEIVSLSPISIMKLDSLSLNGMYSDFDVLNVKELILDFPLDYIERSYLLEEISEIRSLKRLIINSKYISLVGIKFISKMNLDYIKIKHYKKLNVDFLLHIKEIEPSGLRKMVDKVR